MQVSTQAAARNLCVPGRHSASCSTLYGQTAAGTQHTRTCTYMHTHLHKHKPAHTHMLNTRTCTCMHTHKKHTHLHMHAHAPAQTHTKHTHPHIHTPAGLAGCVRWASGTTASRAALPSLPWNSANASRSTPVSCSRSTAGRAPSVLHSFFCSSSPRLQRAKREGPVLFFIRSVVL